MKTLYVGCALRGAPSEFVTSIEILKKDLEQDFEVLHFIGLSPTASAKEIYETDIDCAAHADLMLAVCDVPSLGLGIELAKRAELRKPTVIAYKVGTDLSRMVLGLADVESSFQTVEYSDSAQLLGLMRSFA